MLRMSFLPRALALGLFILATVQACGTDMGPEVDGDGPVDVTASPVGPESIRLSWTTLDRTDVVGYRIARRTNFLGDFESVGDVAASATEFLDTGLDPETFYGYRVLGLLDLGRVTEGSVVAGARTAPAPGVLVRVPTQAPNPGFTDANGYFVEVLSSSGALVASGTVAPNEARRFSPLAPGSYEVRISDVLASCALQSSDRVGVTVLGTGLETLAPVLFQVACKDPTRGEITANLSVTGDTLIAENFTARITGTVADSAVSRSQVVVGGGSTTFINLLPGDYQVEIFPLPAACTQLQPNPSQPATITVTVATTESVDFEVECLRTGGADGVPLVARWRNAQGSPITTAAVGTTVFLELTVELGDSTSLQALQGSVSFNPAVLEYLDGEAEDLALGSGDDLNQFTGGSLQGTSVNFQNYSLSATPNTGTQGVARFSFRTAGEGTARINFLTQVATSFPTPTVRNVTFALDAQPLTIGSSTPQPPVPDLGGPYSGTVGTAISFDGSGSYDPDGGSIAVYTWDFGDGTQGTGVTTSHTYAAPQTYKLKLTVRDDENVSRTDSLDVTVTAAGSGPTLTGGWTDGAGNPITSIGVGQTVKLEICAIQSTVQAYQADLVYDSSLVTATALAELNASAAQVGLCQGANDVVDQFTRGSLGSQRTNHQNFSLASAAGTGPQGLVVATFQTKANGVLQPNLALQVWANFGGAGPQPTVQLPALTIGAVSSVGPTANVGGPYTGSVGAPVSLSGVGSVAGSSPIVRYLWSFGDATPLDSVSGASPSHAFASQGTYSVVLAVRDQDGRTDADTTTATISAQAVPPFAWSNAWLPANSGPGTRVTLVASVHPGSALATATGKVRVDPAVLRFDSIRGNAIWDFAFSGVPEGNGVIAITGSTTQPPPASAPVEVARLFYTVVGGNGTGLTTQTTNVVLVDPALRPLPMTGLSIQESTFSVGAPNVLPVARANGPYTGVAGTLVSFAATGSNDPDGSIVAFDWDFGDGTTGSGAAPRHPYDIVGTYRAVLTVRDNRATVDADTAVVSILEPSTHAWKSAWTRLAPSGPVPSGPMRAPLQTRPDSAGPGDRVALELTARPGSNFQSAVGTVAWDSAVVRLDSVRAGSFATGSFQATPTAGSLTISSGAATAVPGTSPAQLATAYFTVNATAGASTITTSTGVILRNAAQNPLNITNIPILESTLFVAECCDPGSAPVAAAGGPYGAAPGDTVVFNGAGSTGVISSYAWTFGDGANGVGMSPRYAYPAAGSYQVILTVTTGQGATDADTTVVTVAAPPVADAGSPYSGFVGVPLPFSGAASSGVVSGYSWTFGDGNAGSGAAPTHTYASSGTFEVILTVTGPGGVDADTTTASIAIPSVAVAGGPYADTLGASITFDASGSSGATSYSWDFGDGSNGTGVSPMHVYSAAGAYRVILTATGPGGSAVDTTLAAVGNILGGWTNAQGVPIASASVGQTVILEICTNLADTQAFQANLTNDLTIVTRTAMGDLVASSAGTVLCQGSGDVVDQFTGGSGNPQSFQNFSISATAGSGRQGLMRATYTIQPTTATVFNVALGLQVWSRFNGVPAPAQLRVAIPDLIISP